MVAETVSKGLQDSDPGIKPRNVTLLTVSRWTFYVGPGRRRRNKEKTFRYHLQRTVDAPSHQANVYHLPAKYDDFLSFIDRHSISLLNTEYILRPWFSSFFLLLLIWHYRRYYTKDLFLWFFAFSFELGDRFWLAKIGYVNFCFYTDRNQRR